MFLLHKKRKRMLHKPGNYKIMMIHYIKNLQQSITNTALKNVNKMNMKKVVILT